nr:Wzz/FepE/Etk N-terminal domain-containing protein [Chitinophagaceae bacterium]
MNNEISQNNYVSFRAITDYIFSKKKILIVITLLGVIIGIAYAWFQKPKYIAKITYVVEADNGSKMGGYASIAAQFGIDLGQSSNSAFEGDNLNEILKSRTLIEKTLFSYCNNINKNSELLVHKYVQTNNVRMPNGIAFTKDSKGITNRIKDSLINLFIKDLQKRIVVERKDKKLNIITLSIETNEESFSKEFIEKLTENAIQYYTEYKSSRNNFNLKILQNQADSLRVVLFSNIGDAASISDLNVNPLKQSGRISVQKKQID